MSRRRSATGAHIEADGPTVFAHACKLGLEGSIEAPWLALPFWALARLGYREWLSEIYGF
jgi:hypothetical protein